MIVELGGNSYVSRFVNAGKSVSRLAYKASKEVVQITQKPQELTPDRIKELGRNGEQWLRTINRQVDSDMENLERKFSDSLHWYHDSSGAEIGYTANAPIAVVVFPIGSSVFFYHPHRSDPIPSPSHSRALFVPTTHTLVERTEDQYPSEGYRDNITTIPFKPHMEDSPQFGSFLINNEEHTLRVLNWSQTMEELTHPPTSLEILMAANMYIDSDNQEIVCNRPNLRDHFEIYNCLGVMEGKISRRYFTLNSHNFSYRKILEERGIKPLVNSRKVTVWEMAALSNVVTKKFGAKFWKQGYGEYNGGGTYFDIKSKRYHLLIDC